MAENMRVLLIDDHSLFRAGLAELLNRRNVEVVASVSSGSEGISLVDALSPDIVILDIRMPDQDGLNILAQIKSENVDMCVVMVTTSRDDADISRAIKGGAQGYLLKDMEPDELVNSLHSVRKGEIVIAPELAGTLAKVVRGNQPEMSTDSISTLTPREKEILLHLANGGSNKHIARILNISDGTVKLHVKSILRKLNIHSRVEAAVIAVQHELNK